MCFSFMYKISLLLETHVQNNNKTAENLVSVQFTNQNAVFHIKHVLHVNRRAVK